MTGGTGRHRRNLTIGAAGEGHEGMTRRAQ
ncbi:hypothetical protein ACSP50_1360 [Actinoplanes sp. SE50/110]|nr:hypothetical protein ACSP50_1360 [Actinoplanes sp. SE50/110]